MAKSDERIPNWFLWIWEHPVIVVMIVSLLLAMILGGAYYVDNRLSDIESRLAFVPPRSYEAPNLADYAAGDIEAEKLPQRHLVYVPAYSHIYYEGGSPYALETTLSIRNVNPGDAIFVGSVEYFDTTGKLAKTYVDRLIKLAPLQTIEFLVERRDSSGGSGANFLVQWMAESDVDPPLIETVMVGTAGTQAISFGRQGTEISTAKN